MSAESVLPELRRWGLCWLGLRPHLGTFSVLPMLGPHPRPITGKPGIWPREPLLIPTSNQLEKRSLSSRTSARGLETSILLLPFSKDSRDVFGVPGPCPGLGEGVDTSRKVRSPRVAPGEVFSASHRPSSI